MAKGEKTRAESKLLTALYAGEVFEGKTIRQERPRCCGKAIDLFAVNVAFRETIVGRRIFHLIEPQCPICSKRVKATFAIIH